jgi:NitT/TauT family transport system substrate-binding protein
LSPDVVNAAIDAELQYKIPAESVVVDPLQWKNLMAMQIYLKNVKGSIPFEQIVDNSYAEKAIASIKK